MNLASRMHIKLIGVFQIDFSKKTKKANAAVVGMGNTRRVIIADNLLNNFSEDEIEVVCAHEFGHHKLNHLEKLILFSGISSLVGFYLLNILMQNIAAFLKAQNIYDIEIFPIVSLLLFLFSIFIMPLQNMYSRRLETQADLFALRATNNKKSFISLMRKLQAMNLSDEDPPKIIKNILYDHPPIKERIEMAKRFDEVKEKINFNI